MDKRNWKIIYTNYSGMEKKAVEFLSAEVGKYILRDTGIYTLYVLACERLGAKIDKNVIIVGNYNENEEIKKHIRKEDVPTNGYAVKVMKNPENEELNMVLITAFSEENLFYGAIHFVDDFLPSVAPVSGGLRTPKETFYHQLPDYFNTSEPTSKTRSIFTWGHPINNYRRYIENMARLKINQLIIWNDFLPVNAKDVVEYAHEFKIEVIWGFAWGWGTDCSKIDFNELEALKEDIVNKFKTYYIDSGDGIYFQSFTELHTDKIGDKLIAEAVTDFVNDVAGEIFKIKPDFKIQFGLHATSVKDHLEYIAEVDKRVEIIWEDCGVFPYHYLPKVEKEEFDRTMEFTDKILTLRNGEKAGVVYKGMMTMDWTKFSHQSGPYVMGMASDEIIEHDIKMLSPIWKSFQAEWMECGKHILNMTRQIILRYGENVNLCIAGALDGGIWFVPALCTEMMWNPTEDFEKIRERVAKRPCVKFV